MNHMLTHLCAMLLFHCTSSAESATPAALLRLAEREAVPSEISFETLPQIAGQHAVICSATDALKFQLHNYLLHYEGKYWCMFSHGPVVEDMPTQFVSYATSDDGLQWSAARPITPIPAVPYAYIARGFWVLNGELLALVAHFRDKGAFGVNKELKLQAFAWDKKEDVWKFRDTLYEDAINNFPPQRLASGEWAMTRRDSRFNVYMLVGGVESISTWTSYPVVRRGEVPGFSPDEPIWWQLPDGRLHGLFRDNGGSSLLYESFSRDEGKTWSQPQVTNFPNATSKVFVLRLESGEWVLISNANPKMGRRELYVALSDDGCTFTQMARLMIPSTKATTFQYPHAIEHGDHLLLAFSQKKCQTEVMKIPVESVRKMSASTKSSASQ